MKRKASKTKRRHSRRKQSGGQLPNYHFYQKHHYGDNLINLKFFYNIARHLKEKGIKIHYYYNDEYIKDINELNQYVDPNTLVLHPMKEMPVNAIELWMGNPIDGVTHLDYLNYTNKFYKMILDKVGLAHRGIDTSFFQKEPYLLDIYNKLDPKFKDLDILIINSKPQSGQFHDTAGKLDALSIRLAKKYKVAITNPIADSNISCTFTAVPKLTMRDIGAVSTHAKYIIAVFTGPIIPCFNSYTKESVKKWFIMNNHNCDFKGMSAVRIPIADMIDSIESQIVL